MAQTSTRGEVWTVVVAGGSSIRFGSPKMLELIEGKSVLEISMEQARNNSHRVVLVVPGNLLATFDSMADIVVSGGPSRSASVSNGVMAVPQSARSILIHDGARPLASSLLYRRVIAKIDDGALAVVPVVPITDSLKSIDDFGHVKSISRSGFFGAQTPQGFDFNSARAIAQATLDQTDDISTAQALGLEVSYVEGETTNIKITVPSDLVVARALYDYLRLKESGAQPGS
ncbi:IspD/TarI family cytidylyltransferase [Acidithrix ferrooxidans]|uniref:2-C-methyl-D-erythritol 4-phosphate cytidylyltransferase n=1 Tax=Acidithrix ferrooxidans TaxID=1280514 RepID=A0A0D8HJF1_9ACTN|nr:2-C-methyl-D-erythritol 4-phosphate cytidylyltransferase [Acidithrix ferrooxidans]KJF17979.1 2-C-methyl-D-erythritol 4-phosphate cytidylyltransferase [Acidithrix ferrooxidans]